MSRLRIFAFAATFLFLITAPAAAQDPAPPPGYTLVDDMYLPDSVVVADSGFTATMWTANLVPYAFSGNMSGPNQVMCLKAMAEISATAFVTFVPHNNQPNWIVFNSSNVNNSPVGMIGGAQTINITSWGFKFIVVHELMHALGYVHEQSRPDRGNFVTINSGNIQSGQEFNFAIVNGTTTPTAYDFLSIMHYGRTAFSSNNQDTITCNPGYTAYQSLIGNRLYMTVSDALGLQSRYYAPLPPTLYAINPPSLSTASGSFTLNAFGGGFFEGSLTGAGVIGTQITWDGSPVATTYVDTGHVTAQIPASYIAQPQIHQIGVTNPSPAGGPAFNTFQLSVVCSSNVLPLSQNVPVTVSNGCQQFSINPAYNVNNVVAVSSPSDWDITIGGSSATAGSIGCDFVVANGFLGNGTITPTTGNITLFAGNSATTLQHATTTPLNTGSPTIATMNAGEIVRAFHLPTSAVSYRMIDVAGPSNLRWKLIWNGNGFGWRSSTSTYVVAQGQCGAGPVTGIGMVGQGYTLVVYNNGGPLAAPVSFTVAEGFDFTPLALTASANIYTIAQGPYAYQPFTLAIQPNHWNCVGVSSPTDWDIQVGSAVSQNSFSAADYVLANGHLGSILPVTGETSPYNTSGSSGSLEFAPTHALSSFPGSSFAIVLMLECFEFNVTAPGNYDISVSGGSGYAWDLHGPGTGPQWRTRSTALSQGNPANGVPVTMTGLAAGWHAVILRHDGGTAAIGSNIVATYSSLQTPVVTSLAPASAPANSGTFDMTVYGSSFYASSEVRWNGTAVPTTFVSSGELTGHVDNSLIAAKGSASVTAYTPNGGGSNALTFSIDDPIPVTSSIWPSQAVTGDPSLTFSVFGSDFSTTSEVHWGGSPLPTTFVNSGQLDAFLDASNLLAQVFQSVTVFTPSPGGGESTPQYFAVFDPVLAAVTPASMASVPPGSAAFPVNLSGAYFTPYSVVYANGIALPTTFTDSATLDVTIDPATVTQATVPGAIGIVVVNTPVSTSNPLPLVIDGGNNVGLIRTQPLAPAPGSTLTLLIEGGVPLSPLTMIVDLGNPVPVGGFPDGTANFVLAVTQSAGSNGAWFPVVDGLGLFTPPDGSAFDANGVFQMAGITMPDPPLGVDVVLQAAYVDPNAVYGFSLTWALYPLHI